MYEKISRIVPRNVIKAFEKELVYSGIDLEVKNFVGFLTGHKIILMSFFEKLFIFV